MEFPQYRKRFDNKAYYKVTSLTTFEEVLLVGKRFFFHLVQADKYFEQLQVHEMIQCNVEMYKMSSLEEYEEQLGKANHYIETTKKES